MDDQRGLIDVNSLEIPEFLLSSSSTTTTAEQKNEKLTSTASSPSSESSLLNRSKILTRVANVSRSRSPIVVLNDEDEEYEDVNKKTFSIYSGAQSITMTLAT